MGSVTTKGLGIVTTLKWLEQRLDTEQYAQLRAGMPPAAAEILARVRASTWYGLEFSDYAMNFVAALHDEPSARVADLRDLGRFIALDNINTAYRLAFRIATPGAVLGLLPRLWNAYFRGIHAEVHRVPGENQGQCRVAGLGGLRHIGPVAAGWIDLAYELVGARSRSVVELTYDRGEIAADPLLFQVSWD